MTSELILVVVGVTSNFSFKSVELTSFFASSISTFTSGSGLSQIPPLKSMSSVLKKTRSSQYGCTRESLMASLNFPAIALVITPALMLLVEMIGSISKSSSGGSAKQYQTRFEGGGFILTSILPISFFTLTESSSGNTLLVYPRLILALVEIWIDISPV